MERVRQYLANAKECRDIAERAPTAAAKAHFTRMAETWETLARHRREMVDKNHGPTDDESNSIA